VSSAVLSALLWGWVFLRIWQYRKNKWYPGIFF